MTTYSYSLGTDFTSGLDIWEFTNEIKESSIDTDANHFYISAHGDAIDIIFDSAISGADQTTLTNLIGAHAPAGAPRPGSSAHIVIAKNYKWAAYKRVYDFQFNTSLYNGIHSIVVESMRSGGTSYDIKVMDITNGNDIVTKNLTNTEMAFTDLGTLSNVPESGNPVLRICTKRNGGNVRTRVYIDSIIIYYK